MTPAMRRILLTLLAAAALLPAQQPSQPVAIDLSTALQRARQFGQQYVQAQSAAGLAREDRVQAKAALLPTFDVLNQFIYTQPNGTPSGVFVSNDGPHIYNEQLGLHADVFSFAKRADLKRAQAAEAAAKARVDIAARGLSATVVAGYYTVVAAQRRLANTRQSVAEAQQFLTITDKQEKGGEVARADVVKAQLQFQQRQRDASDAEAALAKASIELGVMLFSDPAQPYEVQDDLRADAPLPLLDDLRGAASSSSPDLRAARHQIQASDATIGIARAGYYPTFAVDYFYGFNANVFGFHGPDDRQNLGSVVVATATIPVWNWGATRSKVRQATLLRDQARFDLAYTQRNLQSAVQALYVEAQTAHTQLDSLANSLALSTESLRLTTLRYQAGEATALEVVDAQSTLVQSRNAQVDGLARYRLALAGLEILSGRL